ncbi:MAG: hypothetical protein CVT60_03400 [Actinobacteria bacterium HGW-Actinobacteria-10]|nr:MAG: hypothetical protein CVT60_03400 [Actinobacteria bacterium HGW-Actinobacteria-10]
MVDPTERLVNLAFLLGAECGPITAVRIRDEVAGYGAEDQDEAAFKRMLERDKKELRAMGLVIESDAEGNYRLDRGATFASKVALEPGEAAALRAIGMALLEDPSFPFADELRFALAKIASAVHEHAPRAVAHTADEHPELQGELVASLNGAVQSRKTARFGYTNSYGQHKKHVVEPYGIFARDGRWYAVGRDTDIDEIRVYTVSRVTGLEINANCPGTPDFAKPSDFDVVGYIGLPFQYGDDEISVLLSFAPGEAWRARSLTGGKGDLHAGADSALQWRVTARDRTRLLRWVIENGPGIQVLEPADLVRDYENGLKRVVVAHGGGRNG